MNREKNKEYTRRKLIESAMSLFSNQEYQKTSIDEIAQNAGVTKPTFFSYFKSKEEILYAFDVSQLKVLEEDLDTLIGSSKEMPAKLVDAIVQIALQANPSKKFSQNIIHLGTISSQYRDMLKQIFNELERVICRCIHRAQELEVLSTRITPEHIASDMINIYIGCIVNWSFLDQEGHNLSDIMRTNLLNYLSNRESQD